LAWLKVEKGSVEASGMIFGSWDSCLKLEERGKTRQRRKGRRDEGEKKEISHDTENKNVCIK
jgi:hypothetical protein